MARPEVTPALRDLCLEVFGDLVVRLLGPVLQVSQSFHPQVKGPATNQTILHGYSDDGKEVEASYGLHMDFTAARIVTSPSAMVCWIPLNTCKQNTLRLYPRCHRLGLITNRWLPLDIEGLERIGPPIDIQATEGEALLFNFMMLHGASNPSPVARISCDLRFFPFIGILDNAPLSLRPDPVAWVRERISQVSDEKLLAPMYEALAYWGLPIDWPIVPRHSSLHWARVIDALVNQKPAQRQAAVAQWVNEEVGFDPVGAYQERFAQLKLAERPYAAVHQVVPESARVTGLIPAAEGS